jgi:hypothetical protein
MANEYPAIVEMFKQLIIGVLQIPSSAKLHAHLYSLFHILLFHSPAGGPAAMIK